MSLFHNRREAGRQLVPLLHEYQEQTDALVVGLARGGVETAYEVAHGLALPLTVFVVRKIGAPGNEEFAIGAISETGDTLLNQELIDQLGVSADYLKNTLEKERKIAQERAQRYRGKSPAIDFKGKTIILVDDGIATGASMEVAIHSLRKAHAKKIVLAVPVSAPDSLDRLSKEVDDVVCLFSPSDFYAVGNFYRDFGQTTDEEVVSLLR